MKKYEALFNGHDHEVIETIFGSKGVYHELGKIYEKVQKDWVLALLRKIAESSKSELDAYRKMANIYVKVKKGGKEKTLEILDPFLDKFPELNDHIRELI